MKLEKRDVASINAGVWVTDIPNMGDLRLKVRGLTSARVTAVRSKKERKTPREERERDGSLKHDVLMRIFGEVLAEEVLTDWDNLELPDVDGTVPFDKALALRLLTEPEYQHFADAVTWAASYVDRGMQAEREEAGKNSLPSSNGK